MTKIIIFDLYGTILKDISFDFTKGLDYLYTLGFDEKCTRKEFGAYSEQFIPLYDARATTLKEICFVKEEFPLFEKKFNVNVGLCKEDLDYCIIFNVKHILFIDKH